MQRRNLIALLIGFTFYLGFGWWLFTNQERIVYQPWPHDFADCPALENAARVTHEGTRMYVRFIDGPVAVLYHGNAGSACDRAFLAQKIMESGYGYILVVYSGYSNDPVPPSHARITQDVNNVIAFLDEHATDTVAVIGESIGAGVASYHTRIAPPDRLLLIAPFTDLEAVAATRFWFYPTPVLVNNAWRPSEDLAEYRGPTTIIHGTDDYVIPFRLGEELANELAGDTTLVPILDGGHNDLFQFTATHDALKKFLK
jgi:hypothetical protein